MTSSEIQAYAASMAEVAAENARKSLQNCTPSQFGYPGMTAEQVIAAERQYWIEKDPDEIRIMKRDEEARECWRKQDETRAAKEKYFEGISRGELKHPPAADMVRRSFFVPRYTDADADDLERCLKSAHASPALAVIHEDDDSVCLQIALQDDRAVVISFCKHDGQPNVSVWTGSEHELDDDSVQSWKKWAEIATGKRPHPAS